MALHRLCLLFVLLVGCATSSPVTLDHYAGVYTTHFEGIPDSTRICAVVTNRGDKPVSWVRLRLRAFPVFEERTHRVAASFVYSDGLAPGQSVALELLDPPVAPVLRLTLRGSGSGPAPGGRALERSEECSQNALVADARDAAGARSASGIEVHAISTPDDEAPAEILIALD